MCSYLLSHLVGPVCVVCIHMHVPVSVSMHTLCAVLWRPEEGVGFLGVGITGG